MAFGQQQPGQSCVSLRREEDRNRRGTAHPACMSRFKRRALPARSPASARQCLGSASAGAVRLVEQRPCAPTSRCARSRPTYRPGSRLDLGTPVRPAEPEPSRARGALAAGRRHTGRAARHRPDGAVGPQCEGLDAAECHAGGHSGLRHAPAGRARPAQDPTPAAGFIACVLASARAPVLRARGNFRRLAPRSRPGCHGAAAPERRSRWSWRSRRTRAALPAPRRRARPARPSPAR